MKKSFRVKVLNSFSSPLTNRMVQPGDEFNVPNDRFWRNRLHQKDVQEISAKKKKKAPTVQEKPKGNN